MVLISGIDMTKLSGLWAIGSLESWITFRLFVSGHQQVGAEDAKGGILRILRAAVGFKLLEEWNRRKEVRPAAA